MQDVTQRNARWMQWSCVLNLQCGCVVQRMALHVLSVNSCLSTSVCLASVKCLECWCMKCECLGGGCLAANVVDLNRSGWMLVHGPFSACDTDHASWPSCITDAFFVAKGRIYIVAWFAAWFVRLLMVCLSALVDSLGRVHRKWQKTHKWLVYFYIFS